MDQEQPTLNPAEQHHVSLKFLFVALVVIIVGLSLFFTWTYYYSGPGSRTGNTDFNKLYDAMVSNEKFQLGDRAFKEGNFAEASQYYAQAVETASSKTEEGHYKYLASITNPDIATAIRGYKDIAANPDYDKVEKAYALQRLALRGWRTASSTVDMLVFSDYPYITFYEKDNRGLSYRKLFEYASSFYPLHISEFWIGGWYADRLLRISQQETLTTEDQKSIVELTKVVKTKLKNGNDHLAILRASPAHYQVSIPEATILKAELLSSARRSGDLSFEDPGPVFEEAMRPFPTDPTVEIRARIFYSYYLHKTLKSKAIDQARILLAPLYENFEQYRPSLLFIALAKDESAFGNRLHKRLVDLSEIDPKFKQMLVNLGWKTTNFVVTE